MNSISKDAGDDPIHAALKTAVEVTTEGYLWTQRHEFVPALCGTIFGDGRALLALTTINSRPRYYVIRIDSGWQIDEYTAPDDAVSIRDHLDAIYDAIEEDFGRAVDYDDDPDGEVIAEWPAFDDRDGTSWGRMDWPDLQGVRTEQHPFARGWNVLAA